MTDSKTLSNEQHGNTLFLQSLSEANKGGGDKETSVVELYFDQNPNQFSYILDYLRGYDLKYKLGELNASELQKLQDDAVYFKIKGFRELISGVLHARFDPALGSPLMQLSNNGTVVKRSNDTVEMSWQSRAVYGTLSGTASRYVEINLVDTGNVMLGVTEANGFRVSSYPGDKNYPGCSYFCSNGQLNRSGGSESWGPSSDIGDKVGILVRLDKESQAATITFYKNGELLNKETNLKSCMNVDKGVVFVVAFRGANIQVQLVQNPNF